MARLEALKFKLLLCCLFCLPFILAFAVGEAPGNDSIKALRLPLSPITARSLYEQYSLGQAEEGAKIIYTYQYTETFDTPQQIISLDFQYPDVTAENQDSSPDSSVLIITQIQLYVKSQDGSNTQAYITEGGIGENNISLQIVAIDSNLLNYILVIYGK